VTTAPKCTRVLWGNTTGWCASNIFAQRFDSTGALIGSEVMLNLVAPGPPFRGTPFAVLGDDLLALNVDRQLVRITPGGSVSQTPVGLYGHMASIGSQVLVAWNFFAQLQVALLTP